MRYTRLSIPLYLLSLIVLLLPQQLNSQQERSGEVHQRNDCRLAVQVLVHGQPANKYDWAVAMAENCGTDGADAVAHELRDLRFLTGRTPQLDHLHEIGRRNIDVALFRAGLEIAADPAAGEAARIHAIGLIAFQLANDDMSYELLTSDLMSSGPITLPSAVSEGPLRFRELPPTACSDAVALLQRLSGGDANSTVRTAAVRARYAVEAGCIGSGADDVSGHG